jgi:hypothetical protein
MMPAPDLIIDMDYVIVEGIRINRPSRMSIMQWLDLWERTQVTWDRSRRK